jgi:hypothetical protein
VIRFTRSPAETQGTADPAVEELVKLSEAFNWKTKEDVVAGLKAIQAQRNQPVQPITQPPPAQSVGDQVLAKLLQKMNLSGEAPAQKKVEFVPDPLPREIEDLPDDQKRLYEALHNKVNEANREAFNARQQVLDMSNSIAGISNTQARNVFDQEYISIANSKGLKASDPGLYNAMYALRKGLDAIGAEDPAYQNYSTANLFHILEAAMPREDVTRMDAYTFYQKYPQLYGDIIAAYEASLAQMQIDNKGTATVGSSPNSVKNETREIKKPKTFEGAAAFTNKVFEALTRKKAGG